MIQHIMDYSQTERTLQQMQIAADSKTCVKMDNRHFTVGSVK